MNSLRIEYTEEDGNVGSKILKILREVIRANDKAQYRKKGKPRNRLDHGEAVDYTINVDINKYSYSQVEGYISGFSGMAYPGVTPLPVPGKVEIYKIYGSTVVFKIEE